MIELPTPNSIQRVADWIELAISTTKKSISKAAIASVIESVSGSEPAESFLSGIWRELGHRQKLYAKPCFDVQDRTIDLQTGARPTPEYLACLLLSLYGMQGRIHLPAKLFERLSSRAIEQYISGRAVVFGWPDEDEGGDQDQNESRIKKRTRKIAESTNEKFVEAPGTHYKDRGLDVVGWTPFSEKRPGQIVILLQCAAGHDWKNKLPVPVSAWCQYIHWACDPLRAFAVPSIVDERDWHDISRDKGILFDRARIINLLSNSPSDRQLVRELRNWVKAQLAEVDETA